LRHVTIEGNAFCGLHVDDLAGSPAGISLTAFASRIASNGRPDFVAGTYDDKDGIRIDERGDGSIDVRLVMTTVSDNAYDGVEFDEAGAGDVRAQVSMSAFEGNGYGSLGGPGGFDYEDGFDIDEADDGDVQVDVWSSIANRNHEEGWDLDEAGPGSLIAHFKHVDVSENATEGIQLTESEADADGGDVELYLNGFRVADNLGEGIKVDERRAGALRAVFSNGTVTHNSDGISLNETEDGALDVRVEQVQCTNNLGNGLDFMEGLAGDLHAVLSQVEINSNTKKALSLRQLQDGLGTLVLSDVSISGNGQDEPRLVGMTAE
jgi:hypothetical protein